MKKRILICVTCITVAGLYAEAQNKSTTVTSNESYAIAPPPPPAPPIPPPPPPPVSPIPVYDEVSVTREIINNNGNEISIVNIKGTKMVIIKNDGKTQRIKLSTWNASRKYYEKKYGQLPPPPPPAPPVVEEVQFTPPVIKDNQQ